jgi:hypothetical protein
MDAEGVAPNMDTEGVTLKDERTPKALRLKAQGCALATLGQHGTNFNAEGVASAVCLTAGMQTVAQPLRSWKIIREQSQGCQSATLGFESKRFQRFCRESLFIITGVKIKSFYGFFAAANALSIASRKPSSLRFFNNTPLMKIDGVLLTP